MLGANTVIAFCEFRVSTRPAFVTAVTSVESAGLALAAEATGAVAMPLNEPGPDFGTAAQPEPKVWAPASDVVPVVLPPVVSAAEELLSLLPHAARLSEAPRAIAAIPERRSVVFMVPSSCGGTVIWCSCRRAVRIGPGG